MRWGRGSALSACAVACAAAFGWASPAAHATLSLGSTTIVPYQATGYRYQQVASGHEPSGWQSPSFDDSSWSTGNAAFGSGGICPLQPTVSTHWDVDTDMLVRRTVTLPAGTSGVTVSIAVDNDVRVYWNGTLVGSATHENCPAYDDFTFSVPDSALNSGANTLAVEGIDRGFEDFLDISVSGAVGLGGSCDSSTVSDELANAAAHICSLATDEATISQHESALLGFAAKFPQVSSAGANTWTAKLQPGFVSQSDESDAEQEVAYLEDVRDTMVGDIVDIIGDKALDKLDLPCSYDFFSKLQKAEQDDLDVIDQDKRALDELEQAPHSGVATVLVVNYLVLADRALLSKLQDLSDALKDYAQGCLLSQADYEQLVVILQQAAASVSGDAAEVEAASAQISLLPLGGWNAYPTTGTTISSFPSGWTVAPDHAQFPLGTNLFPSGVPFGDRIVLEPLVPTSNDPLTPSSSSVNTGGTLHIGGFGFHPLTPGYFELKSAPLQLGTFLVDADGSFSADVTIPVDAPTGSHTLYAIGSGPDGSLRVLAVGLTVTDDDLALVDVPGDMTIDATSPAGAAATFTLPGAADEDAAAPTVACDHASGATFPIGTTTVTCTASGTDDTNAPATASFTVTVRGALDQLRDLVDYVNGLPPGTSLRDKTQSALAYLQAGDDADACATLAATANEARAQSGKHLTAAQSAHVVDAATRIAAVVGC